MGIKSTLNYVHLSDDYIYDLPMIGGEILYVKYKLDQLTGGSSKKLRSSVGTYVEVPEGELYQLQEYAEDPYPQRLIRTMLLVYDELPELLTDDGLLYLYTELPGIFLRTFQQKFNYNLYILCPAGCLPEDSELVVRASALLELEKWLDDEEKTEQHSSEESGKVELPSKNEEKTDLAGEKIEHLAESKTGGEENTPKLSFKTYAQIFPDLKGHVLREERDTLRIIGALKIFLTEKHENVELPSISKKVLMNDVADLMTTLNIENPTSIEGLSISSQEDRYPTKGMIERQVPRFPKSADNCIIYAQYVLIRGKLPDYVLPFETDDALILTLFKLVKNIFEMDKQTLTKRIKTAEREIESALDRSGTKGP